MSQKFYDESFSGSAPENYERYFVPAIGRPLAKELISIAALRPGERVLDVASGTGVVARLAAEQVGAKGKVLGLDVNAGMLVVARSSTPSEISIEWQEASAEAMPLPDESFDVLLCQMGLQFMPDKKAALAEIFRVLVPGGRLILNLPGPTPKPFVIMKEALERHVSPEVGGFVGQVFSLHDIAEVQGLLNKAGFREVSVQASTKELRLPAPEKFFQEYLLSTPIGEAVGKVIPPQRALLAREVIDQWKAFEEDKAMLLQVRVVVATALK